MALLPIAYGASKRLTGMFPEMTLLNAIVEKAPSQQERPLAILARPGLMDHGTIGTGPIRCAVTKAGLFDTDALVLSGDTLYRQAETGVSTALTGTVAGRNRVRCDLGRNASDADQARIATGDALYLATSTTVTEEDFPSVGGAGAQDIMFHRGFWVGIEAGTDKAYYQIPGTTTWNALDFASAEYQPDKLVACRSLRDQIWLLGDVTAEVFTLTGAAPSIAPYGGLAFDVGCRARDTVCTVDGAIIWVDNHCNVQISTGGEPAMVSDAGLAEIIRDTVAEDLRAWSFSLHSHVYYVLTGTDWTWVYDRSVGTWAKWNSNGYDYFRGHLGCEHAEMVMCVDALQGSGQVWRVEPDLMDDDGEEFAVEFSAYMEVKEGRVPVASVELIGLTGDVPMTGQGSEPLVGMRYSDDGAKTWSSWRWASMQTTGQYRGRVRWRQLGQARAPQGRVFRFRCSEPIGRRFSDLRVNAR